MAGLLDARLSVGDSLRGFRWFEYRPFAWIMAVQLLFLVCATNLGSLWGMAGAGWLMGLTRETGLHYPTSYVVLPVACSYLDMLLFVSLGSFLIPLSLVRLVARREGSTQSGPIAVRRAWGAVPATLCGSLLSIGLLLGWQWVYLHGAGRLFQSVLGVFGGALVGLLLSELVSFAIAALFVYVPVRAVAIGPRLADALLGGVGEGLKMFGPTLLVILLLSWPVLIFLVPIQLWTVTVVTKFRPELVALGLCVVAILNSLVNYLIFASVTRLHSLASREVDL